MPNGELSLDELPAVQAWANPLMPTPPVSAPARLAPWVSPGRAHLVDEPTADQVALWEAAGAEANRWWIWGAPMPVPQFPRKIWPDWVDLLNAMIAIEWRGFTLPDDPLDDWLRRERLRPFTDHALADDPAVRLQRVRP